MLHGRLWTVFGWHYHVGATLKPRTLRNFPMQANGAEMLRLACCYAIQRGVKVIAPVHDALLIEAPVNNLDLVVEKAQQAMADASAAVLGGFRLRSDATVIRYPDHYSDPRGLTMWQTFWAVVADRAKVEVRGDSRAGMRRAIKRAVHEARESKRREVEWKKAALEILADNTIHAFITDIYRRGGFKYSALAVDFGAETIRELNRKRPGLVSSRGRLLADEMAEEYGFDSDDALIQAILMAPALSEAVHRQVEMFREEWNSATDEMQADEHPHDCPF